MVAHALALEVIFNYSDMVCVGANDIKFLGSQFEEQ